MGFGLVGLHMKSMLSGESFSVPRNEPAVGGAISPGSARSQVPEHQENTVNTKYDI